eukprot:364050-Chlamydomonas_euryale.AAC.9
MAVCSQTPASMACDRAPIDIFLVRWSTASCPWVLTTHFATLNADLGTAPGRRFEHGHADLCGPPPGARGHQPPGVACVGGVGDVCAGWGGFNSRLAGLT